MPYPKVEIDSDIRPEGIRKVLLKSPSA